MRVQIMEDLWRVPETEFGGDLRLVNLARRE